MKNMENPIKVEGRSLTQLTMWFIIACLILSIGLFYYLFRFLMATKPALGYWLILIVPVGFTVYAFKIFSPVAKAWARWESYEYKLQEEKCVSEVVNQDFKLLQMKIMEDEHNMKIRDYNKN